MLRHPLLVQTVRDYNVDTLKMPPLDEKNQVKEGWELTIGDLHADTIKLMYLLKRHGIALGMTEDDYNNLVRIYNIAAYDITADDLNKFEEIINKLEMNASSLLRLIGDDVADRRMNDFLTLITLLKLHRTKVPYEILISNHGIEFVLAYESNNGFSEVMLHSQFVYSMLGLKKIIDRGLVTRERVQQIIDEAYKPHLKALSYALSPDRSELIFFGHAPHDVAVIASMARKIKVYFDDSSPLALALTIEKINEEFQKYVQANKVHTLVDKEQLMKGYIGQEQIDYEQYPFEFIMWNRFTDSLKRTKTHNGYKVGFGHGHTATWVDPDNVVNLDTLLGKSINHTTGDYKVLFSNYTPLTLQERATAEVAREQKISASQTALPVALVAAPEPPQFITAANQSQPDVEYGSSTTTLTDEEIFQNASRAFQAKLDTGNSTDALVMAGNNLLKIVSERKKLSFAYRTELIQAAHDLHDNPYDTNLQSNFNIVRQKNTDGNASERGIFAGACMLFLGTVLVAASLAVGIFTFGLTAPLTLAGIGLGVLTIAGGITAICASSPSGTAKALNQVEEAALKKVGFFAKPAIPLAIDEPARFTYSSSYSQKV